MYCIFGTQNLGTPHCRSRSEASCSIYFCEELLESQSLVGLATEDGYSCNLRIGREVARGPWLMNATRCVAFVPSRVCCYPDRVHLPSHPTPFPLSEVIIGLTAVANTVNIAS